MAAGVGLLKNALARSALEHVARNQLRFTPQQSNFGDDAVALLSVFAVIDHDVSAGLC